MKLVNPGTGLLILVYLTMTVSYSRFLKNVPHVHVAILAIGTRWSELVRHGTARR